MAAVGGVREIRDAAVVPADELKSARVFSLPRCPQGSDLQASLASSIHRLGGVDEVQQPGAVALFEQTHAALCARLRQEFTGLRQERLDPPLLSHAMYEERGHDGDDRGGNRRGARDPLQVRDPLPPEFPVGHVLADPAPVEDALVHAIPHPKVALVHAHESGDLEQTRHRVGVIRRSVLSAEGMPVER